MNRFYTVLCEDLQAWVFIRQALIRAGADGRNIFKHPFPDSRFHAAGGSSPRTVEGYVVYACGSQHVRMNFPRALARVRTQHAKRQAALVVHIDVDNATADGRTVRDRLRELDAACADAKMSARVAADPVAILVPRREIETWIHFLLNGTAVDEHTEYAKLREHEADCQPAAQIFAQHARAQTSPPGSSPSLADGLREFAGVI